MMQAKHRSGKIVAATKEILEREGFQCPLCLGPVRLRAGEKNRPHWSHVATSEDCDPWWEPMTQWHLEWQEFFAKLGAQIEVPMEVDGEKHRADVVYQGWVIELQHSSLVAADIIARERFYGQKMIWIFDNTQKAPWGSADGNSWDGKSRIPGAPHPIMSVRRTAFAEITCTDDDAEPLRLLSKPDGVQTNYPFDCTLLKRSSWLQNLPDILANPYPFINNILDPRLALLRPYEIFIFDGHHFKFLAYDNSYIHWQEYSNQEAQVKHLSGVFIAEDDQEGFLGRDQVQGLNGLYYIHQIRLYARSLDSDVSVLFYCDLPDLIHSNAKVKLSSFYRVCKKFDKKSSTKISFISKRLPFDHEIMNSLFHGLKLHFNNLEINEELAILDYIFCSQLSTDFRFISINSEFERLESWKVGSLKGWKIERRN